MRIITGSAKGRHIKIPKDVDFRPTSDKTRETLFNIIGMRIENSIFLDCFAGSGAVGLEAASRGAAKIIAIERNRGNCRLIKDNFDVLGLGDKLELVEDDYICALSHLNRNNIIPDILFFDPPYYAGIYDRLVEFLAQNGSVGQGLIILEHFKKTVIQYEQAFDLQKVSKSGDTHLTFLTKKISPNLDTAS